MLATQASTNGVEKAPTAREVAMMSPPMMVERAVLAGSKNSRKGFSFPFGWSTKPRYSLPGADTKQENMTVANIAFARPPGVDIIVLLLFVIQPIMLFRATP